MTSDGRPYCRVRFEQIVEEQVTLGYLTKGGVSYSDTESMTPHERKLALEVVEKIIERQNKVRQEMVDKSSRRTDPKTALTSGVKV